MLLSPARSGAWCTCLMRVALRDLPGHEALPEARAGRGARSPYASQPVGAATAAFNRLLIVFPGATLPWEGRQERRRRFRQAPYQ